jgi:2-polyprenyl-3-methyl-5-hydroxy-6-metoxy-1,4-benzoquinol methylase
MDAVERLSLDTISEQDLLAAEHVLRYELAAEVVPGGRIVDLCCGVGYGSRILARAGREVKGVDVAQDAVEEARRAFADVEGVQFEQADAVEYLHRLQPEDVDAIVCFEGLEHLARLDAAVGELRRLAEGGVALLVSVPNSKMIGEENEFHLTDFGFEEARELAASLPGAQLVGQFNADGSILARGGLEGEARCELVLGDHAEIDYANHYLLGVGLDEALDAALPQGRMRLALAAHNNRYMRQLERVNRELYQANQRLARGYRGRFDSAAAALGAKAEAYRREVEKAKADIEFMQEQVRIANADAQQARDAAALAELRLEALRNRKVVRAALRAASAIPRPKRG